MKKKLLTIMLTAFITITAAAQKPRFGINAGALTGTAKITVDNESTTSSGRIGFTVGILSDMPIGSQFSFRPELNFLQKGGKDKETFMGSTETLSVGINYLELPLNFVYNSKGKTGAFIIGAGPSLSYALSGKMKVTADGESASDKLNIGNSSDDDIKAFEFGGNFLTGYEFASGITISANYNIGFSNISADSESKWKNNYFGIRLGYLFSQQGKK